MTLLIVPAAAQATVFEVNNATVVTDGSGCDAVHCSLPEAITGANLNSGPDEIAFDGVSSITVPSPTVLPSITGQVTIAGAGGGSTNCDGAPQVTLLGHSGAVGLQLDDGSDGSRICRLIIGNFNTGIAVLPGADGVTVERNRLGTDGTVALAQSFGVTTEANTTIRRNTISGNTTTGVSISAGAGAATVTGNAIGTNPAGNSAIPNGQGLWVSSPTAVVGGTGVGEPNLISGNTSNGVIADAGTIVGNFIGTTATGNLALPNAAGMNLPANSTARVGGPAAGERNVISGNTAGPGIRVFSGTADIRGNYIGTNAAGSAAVPNQDGVHIREGATNFVLGGTGAADGNIISGNSDDGIHVAASGVAVSGVSIRGNTVGLSADKTAVLANSGNGIEVGGAATAATVGGTTPGAGNLIAGSPVEGLFIEGDNTQVQQNVIGLNAAGTAVPNVTGIRTGSNSEGTVIGGTSAAARNVIGGNSSRGILLGQGSSTATVQGNYIGLAADGTTTKPNATGIRIDNANNAQVGGPAAGAGNVISGNTQYGVSIIGGPSDAPVLEGNLIGTDATGLLARGNTQGGILLAQSLNARIGGTAPGARNVISGNLAHGLDVQTGVNGAQVHGNLIGVGADGATAVGNAKSGVFVQHQSLAFTLGGTVAGQGNTIRHNTENGIAVGPAISPVLQASLFGNSVRDNGELGIDLGDDGVTANDAGDVDAGDNDRQNFPVLTAASTDGLQTGVSGTIDTTPGRQIRIEVFSSAACDASGHGEGDTFLGATEVTAVAGAAVFSATLAATDPGRQLTATATDLTTGQTSEFSACQPVAFVPPPTPIGPSSPLLPEAPAPAPAGAAPAPVTAKAPAKLKVRRAGIDDGVLDLLVEITSAAATSGAKLEVDYESSGRHTKFSVPITTATKASGGEALITIRKKLPATQPKDTGIVEIAYAGNSAVAPDEVRLRAADVQALLVRSSSSLTGGRLRATGTISSKARGVVRLRFGYTEPNGTAAFQSFNADVKNGRWSVDRTLTGAAANGGYLSIQFTGYEAAGMRGEQTGKQLP